MVSDDARARINEMVARARVRGREAAQRAREEARRERRERAQSRREEREQRREPEIRREVERNRRRTLRVINWIKRGFVPAEAFYLTDLRFDLNRARPGSNMGTFLRAIIQRRRLLIERLKALGFTERDIFNYLTETAVNRDRGVEDFRAEFSEMGGFASRAERTRFVRRDVERPTAEILEEATFNNWSLDSDEGLAWRNYWVPYRIRRLPIEQRSIEVSSRFPNIRRAE